MPCSCCARFSTWATTRSRSPWARAPRRSGRSLTARQHVEALKPRETASPRQVATTLEAFQRAVQTGDLQSILDVLAPDVVLVGDGGGRKQAALRPIIGAEKALRFFGGIMAKTAGTITSGQTSVNGTPALEFRIDGELDGVLAVRLEAGHVTGLYYVRNPEKLTRLASDTVLTRR